jgi:type II secretory pathway pseudopilin PulG
MPIRRYASQAGDTIIEVMFAVAVVGMVIGGSYVVATRAQRVGRYAQEQTEALKQVEAQIEKVKYLAGLGITSGANYIFDTTAGKTTFCISDTYTKVLASDSSYDANCKGRGGSGLYDVKVDYQAVPADGGTDLFVVNASWDRQGTAERGNVSIAYRVHNAPAEDS